MLELKSYNWKLSKLWPESKPLYSQYFVKHWDMYCLRIKFIVIQLRHVAT